ncbi:MAG: hypothetical protein IJP23_04480 [Oscillospiraceae bacterium]|nr:hypothetical protein [Oscillospiraceae bacterium]
MLDDFNFTPGAIVGLVIMALLLVFFIWARKYLRYCVRPKRKQRNPRAEKSMWLLYWCFFALIILTVMSAVGIIEGENKYSWLFLLAVTIVWLLAIIWYTDFTILAGFLGKDSNSPYFRQTGNKPADVVKEGPIKTEYELYCSLDTIKGYKRIVVAPRLTGTDGKAYDLEMVCFTEKVIIVADSLFKDGRWNGEMLDESWGHETQKARFSMPNPLLVNQEKIIALHNFLCDKNEGFADKINLDRYINFTLCGLNSQLSIKGTAPNNCMIFSRQVEKQFYDIFTGLESAYDKEFIDRAADLLESRASYNLEQRLKVIERKYKPYKPSGKIEKMTFATVLDPSTKKTTIVRYASSGYAEYDGVLFLPASAHDLEKRGLKDLAEELKTGGDNVFDNFYDAFDQSTDIMELANEAGAPTGQGELDWYLNNELSYAPKYFMPEK